MILPGKHLASERALLTVGGRLLANLNEPRTVSALWDLVRLRRDAREGKAQFLTTGSSWRWTCSLWLARSPTWMA